MVCSDLNNCNFVHLIKCNCFILYIFENIKLSLVTKLRALMCVIEMHVFIEEGFLFLSKGTDLYSCRPESF